MSAQLDRVFAALADPTRRTVLESLAAGREVTASGLADGLPMTRQAVAKHLGVLGDAGLVTSRRVGRETRYALRAAPLGEAGEWILRTGAAWDERLARLRGRAERSS